mgnify:CR=1 FL=1|jgi:hypothetical protein
MAEAEEWPLPINPDEFDKDERISFSKLDNKYIAVQDDGTEYEFDEAQKRWVPIDYADDDLNEGGIPNFDSEAQQPAPQGTKRKLDDWDDREVSCAHTLLLLSCPSFVCKRRPSHMPPFMPLPTITIP